MIQIQHVTKRYENGVVALKDINLQLDEHKRIVFFGISGCGKTTLLRIIAGLEKPSEGNVLLDKDQKISFMFQDDHLLDEISVLDNISYGIDQRTISKNDLRKKSLGLALWAGVQDILDQKTKTLSGGQRQRVSLARALMKDPDILLIDEGLNSLDRNAKEEIIGKLIQAQDKRKFTIFYVTHDEREAQWIGQNFVLFSEPGIVQKGTI